MALSQKFRDAVSGVAVNVSSLYVDTLSCITRRTCRKEIRTIYTSDDSGGKSNIKVFLPRRYSAVFTVVDMAVINDQTFEILSNI